jgi:hypothetical protein
MNTGRVNKVVLILPLLAAVTALAEQPQAREEDHEAREKGKFAIDEPTLAALPAEYCFTSGSATAPNYLKICISSRGNITRFESPFGLNHITGREGYVLCADDDKNVAVGFDAGMVQDGWGPPSNSQPNGAGTLPLIVTRTSLDGRVQLKQTFTRNTVDRGLDVKMDVKNISTASLPGVILDRYFDADVDNSGSDDYWDRSRSESVWAKHDPQGEMVLLTAAQPTFGAVSAAAETFGRWTPNGSTQSARACVAYVTIESKFDGVGRVQRFFGPINPGVTKSVTFRYRRY